MSHSDFFSILTLDKKGRATPLSWDDFKSNNTDGLPWLHLNFSDKEKIEWIRNESDLQGPVIEALLTQDARPRCFTVNNGLLVLFRGVNLNPGRDPEDMVSVRAWITKDQIITIYREKIFAVADIINQFKTGDGPTGPGDFLVQLADRISTRMTDIILEIDASVDDLEDEVLDHGNVTIRSTLSSLRRQIIRLRKYLIPQREVMAQLQFEKTDWLTTIDRNHLRESSDKTIRYLDDINSAKERASIAKDELESRVNAQMNRNMYVISIITAIFLPLGFITGLFGANVAGLPGLNNPNGFLYLCGAMAIISTLQILFFKIMKWL